MAPRPSYKFAAKKSVPKGKTQVQKQPVDDMASWLSVHGPAEYDIYKSRNARPHLRFEEWSKSDHVLGPYLFHLALDAYGDSSDEDSDDDEEIEQGKQAAQAAPAPSAQKKARGRPPKSAQVADHGAANGENTPTTASGKKRRKRKLKKHLSEDIIRDDEDGEDVEMVHAPEAEDADTVTHAPATTSKKTSAKKSASRASSQPSNKAPPQPKPTSNSTPASTLATPDRTPTPGNVSPSPSPGMRSGLRVRNQAQQHPYLYHERIFEEQLKRTGAAEEPSSNGPKQRRKSRLARVSFPAATDDEGEVAAHNTDTNEEGLMRAVDEDEDIENHVTGAEEGKPKKKTFKGKGRAWKKGSEDEDEDFVVKAIASKTTAAKSPATKGPPTNGTAPNQPASASKTGKKRGRPPKNRQSLELQGQIPTYATAKGKGLPAEHEDSPRSESPEKRKRRRPRPHKSEEFVRDDTSDDEDTAQAAPETRGSHGEEVEERGQDARPYQTLKIRLTQRGPPSSSTPSVKPEGNDGGDVIVLDEESSTQSASRRRSTTTATEKQKRRSLKSFKSEEFVKDDSTSEDEAETPELPYANGDKAGQELDGENEAEQEKQNLGTNFLAAPATATPSLPKKRQNVQLTLKASEKKKDKQDKKETAKRRRKSSSKTSVEKMDEGVGETEQEQDVGDKENGTPGTQEKKRKRKARKAYRSSEFVVEDSSDVNPALPGTAEQRIPSDSPKHPERRSPAPHINGDTTPEGKADNDNARTAAEEPTEKATTPDDQGPTQASPAPAPAPVPSPKQTPTRKAKRKTQTPQSAPRSTAGFTAVNGN